MSVETRGFIKSNINPIYKFIKTLDKNATLRDMTEVVGEPGMFYIEFELTGEAKKLTINKLWQGGVFVAKDEEEYEKRYGKQDEPDSESYMLNKYGVKDNTKGVQIELDASDLAIPIVQLICLNFGGWICERDYDPNYKYMRKNGSKKPIFDYVFEGE